MDALSDDGLLLSNQSILNIRTQSPARLDNWQLTLIEKYVGVQRKNDTKQIFHLFPLKNLASDIMR